SILSSIINSASVPKSSTTLKSPSPAPPRTTSSTASSSAAATSAPPTATTASPSRRRLGVSFVGATGGALLLDRCFVRYDNTSFVGDEDKAVVSDKCGPSVANDTDPLARRDASCRI
ncbi:cysteine-rich repeat secretory protein 60, partial [Phtheirospermum japonicum]